MSQDVLASCIDKPVMIVTKDGRVILGYLRGYDQQINVVLEHSKERLFCGPQEPVKEASLGFYVFRGEDIVMVCEVDQEKDAAIDYSKVIAPPLKPLVY